MSKKIRAPQHIQDCNITVTGRHVHVTDAMKDYAVDKISKVDRFTDKVIDVNITMDIQKREHRAIIVIKEGHTKIRASATSEDMYASVDMAVTRLQSQLLKYKKRLHNHRAKSTSVIDMNVNVLATSGDDIEEINTDIEKENLRIVEDKYVPHPIVKQETRPLKLLTVEEAVMKIELSGDIFMIFKSEEDDNKIKVIYRRDDGNYAVIEPE